MIKQHKWRDRDDNKLLADLRKAETKHQQKRYAKAVFMYVTLFLVSVFLLVLWITTTFRG